MVMALIEVLAGQPAGVKPDYMEAVRRAVCRCLCTPYDDPAIRPIEHDPSDIAVPPLLTARYTKVTVTIFEGRTLDTKRRLYHSLVAELAGLGVPADDMQVVVHEPPVKTWSLGGTPANDVDPGFEIKISMISDGRPPAACPVACARGGSRVVQLGSVTTNAPGHMTGLLVLRPAD